MRHWITAIMVILCASAGFAYHIHPEAKPGPEPGVKSFSEEELARQQDTAPVVESSSYLEREDVITEAPDVPDASAAPIVLGVGDKVKPVDGTQVLKSAEASSKRGNLLWKVLIGVVACSGLGFGGVLVAKGWVEKKVPDPQAATTAEDPSTSRTYRL